MTQRTYQPCDVTGPSSGNQRMDTLPSPFRLACQRIAEVDTDVMRAPEAPGRGPDGSGAKTILDQVTHGTGYRVVQQPHTPAQEMPSQVAASAAVSINFRAGATYEPGRCIQAPSYAAAWDDVPIRRMVFKVSESDPTLGRGNVHSTIAGDGRQGPMTATDGIGAGLNRTVDVDPGSITCNITVSRNVDSDHACRGAGRFDVEPARQLGIAVIAEVEHAARRARSSSRAPDQPPPRPSVCHSPGRAGASSRRVEPTGFDRGTRPPAPADGLIRRNRSPRVGRGRRVVRQLLGTVALVSLAGCSTPSGSPIGAETTVSGQNFMSIAEKAERAGDYGTAATFYRKAAETREDGVEPEIALGRTLYRAENYAQAEKAYKRAIRQAPREPAAHLGLGKTLIALDRPEAAIDSFEAGQELSESGRVAGYIGKGVALDMLGRHTAAQRVYDAGLSRAPNNIKLLNNYGLSLALSGDLKTAVEVLEPLADTDEASERVRQNLALAYGLQGHLKKAAEVANYDLSPGAVDNNLRYYEIARELVRSTGSTDALGATTPSAAGPDASPSPVGSYWAQLGAFESADRARRTWDRLKGAHPDVLGDRSLDLQVTNVEGEGRLHRMRIGPFEASDGPADVCAKLESRGQACVVMQDGRTS